MKARNQPKLEHNQLLRQKWESGDLTREQVQEQAIPLERVPRGRSSAKHSCARFRKEFDWSSRAQPDKTHKYLTIHHPSMKELRQKLASLIESKQVHPRMVLNIDHVFTFKHRVRTRQTKLVKKSTASVGVASSEYRPKQGSLQHYRITKVLAKKFKADGETRTIPGKGTHPVAATWAHKGKQKRSEDEPEANPRQAEAFGVKPDTCG